MEANVAGRSQSEEDKFGETGRAKPIGPCCLLGHSLRGPVSL